MSNGQPVQLMNIYVPEEYMTQNADGTCGINASGSKTVTYYDEAGNETGTYTWTGRNRAHRLYQHCQRLCRKLPLLHH